MDTVHQGEEVKLVECEVAGDTVSIRPWQEEETDEGWCPFSFHSVQDHTPWHGSTYTQGEPASHVS